MFSFTWWRKDEKVEMLRGLSGSFNCYCYALDPAGSPFLNLPEHKDFKELIDKQSTNDIFRTQGCPNVAMYQSQIDMWSYEIAGLAAIFNALGELVTEFMADYFDFGSISTEQTFKRRTMQGILTFNNNIMVIFVGAHVAGNGVLSMIFNGSFTDFSSKWYEVMGQQIVVGYIVNVIAWVFTYFGLCQFVRLLFVWADQGCCKCKRKPNANQTKKTSIQSYVELYGGADYDFFYK